MRLLAGLSFLAVVATTTPFPLSAQTPPPLIERARLFGNPSKVQARLSPDGKWISWIAPRDSVLNIWVAPFAGPTNGRPLTAETARPIRSYFWAPDSSQILFVNDKGGDENFLLYSVDPVSAQQRTLTPFEKTRVEIVGTSDHVTDRILLGLNNRDPRWHDVYSLDLKTGPRVNKAESDQIVSAMAAKNIPVTYVLFPDEGHGFARPENNIAFNAVAENFLKTCLGGRSEPIGDALKASSAQVPHGAQFASGLAEALSGR